MVLAGGPLVLASLIPLWLTIGDLVIEGVAVVIIGAGTLRTSLSAWHFANYVAAIALAIGLFIMWGAHTLEMCYSISPTPTSIQEVMPTGLHIAVFAWLTVNPWLYFLVAWIAYRFRFCYLHPEQHGEKQYYQPVEV